jgi:hypothetical protein
MTGDYRAIPGAVEARDLVMPHISTNFDRTGFQQDWNVVFPLDRLRELAGEGIGGSARIRNRRCQKPGGLGLPGKLQPGN